MITNDPYLDYAMGNFLCWDHELIMTAEQAWDILNGDKPNQDENEDRIFHHWEPFEYDEWETVIDHITSMYESLKRNFIAREDI